MSEAKPKLTDEPGVALIILDGEIQEVVLEALDRIRLRLNGQGALHLGLVPVAHQIPGAPAVASDPRERARRVAPPDCLHQAGDLLVATVNNAACNI